LISVVILLAGRALLGGAESFIIAAAVSWGLALAPARNHRQGDRMGRVGHVRGLRHRCARRLRALCSLRVCSDLAATTLAPLAVLPLVALLPAVASAKHARASFVEVIGAIWVPGLGSALGSVGFGAVTTFVALLFATRGWANGWSAYTAYAVAFSAGVLQSSCR
jgi:hypothetical protein